MATITKRGNHQWQVKIRAKGFPPQTKTFTSRIDAEKWARHLENEMDRGIFVDRSEAEATTLHDALDRYGREVSALKRTHKKELSIIKSWQASTLAGMSLAQLRGVDLAKWRDDRLQQVGVATVRNELALLSHLYTTASKDWGMGVVNPVASVRKPPPVRGRDRRLSDAELDSIITTTQSVELPAIIRLLTETAMRRGELSRLVWERVDLENRTAHLIKTKNGEDRFVPLSARAVGCLQSVKSSREDEGREISGQVFLMTPDAITRAFSRACKRAKIQDARLHDLRHEAVSRLFEKELNSMEVASVSGHKTLSMLRRYTHLHAKDLAKKLG